MEKNIKDLLAAVHDKELSTLIKDHVKSVTADDDSTDIVILVDKQYVINQIEATPHIEPLTEAVQALFGENRCPVLRLETPHHGHDREMLVPHSIHR